MNSATSKPETDPDELDHGLDKLQAFVRAAPDQPSGWIRLARRLESVGEHPRALDAWTHARLLVPDSPVVAQSVDRLDEIFGPLAEPGDSSMEDSNQDHGAQSVADPVQSAQPSEARLDLDALITDLQSGRRQPSLDYVDADGSVENVGSEDVVASETLAKIYESQNHLAEAAKIYESLAEREADGDRADILRARAADIRKRIPN